MSIILKLPKIITKSIEKLENQAKRNIDIHLVEGHLSDNKIIRGDNYEYLLYLYNNGYKGLVDMIYIDPPFFSNADYKAKISTENTLLKDISIIEQKAYKDTWENGMEEYMQALTDRLVIMQALLKDTGVIFLHLDWHIVHYIKVIMDEIFGADHFVNEIIWTYKSGGVSKRYFARKHDTILMYGKSKKYKFNQLKEKSYNRGLKPYKFKNVEEFKDDIGWHTMVNMKDVWQIDMVGRTSGERVSYATQKPEKLLERVIESTTEKGDLCIDFYGGSGTLGAVAEKLDRKWIMCDQGDLSILTQLKRMTNIKENYNYEQIGLKANIADVQYSINRSEDQTDKDSLAVNLEEYRYFDISDLPIHQKHHDLIQSISAKESISLIDYIVVTEVDDINKRPTYKEMDMSKNNNHSIAFNINKNKQYEMILIDIFGVKTKKIIKKG